MNSQTRKTKALREDNLLMVMVMKVADAEVVVIAERFDIGSGRAASAVVDVDATLKPHFV